MAPLSVSIKTPWREMSSRTMCGAKVSGRRAVRKSSSVCRNVHSVAKIKSVPVNQGRRRVLLQLVKRWRMNGRMKNSNFETWLVKEVWCQLGAPTEVTQDDVKFYEECVAVAVHIACEHVLVDGPFARLDGSRKGQRTEVRMHA